MGADSGFGCVVFRGESAGTKCSLSHAPCQVPGAEGKAGMAVIVTSTADYDNEEEGDVQAVSGGPESLAPPVPLEAFLANLRHNLPPYAIPIFLRMVSSIDTTGE